MSVGLKIDYGFDEDIAILNFSGDLDMNSIHKAYDAVDETVDRGYVKIIFNLENLGFIDSTGLGFFTGSLKKLKEKNGELKLCSPSAYIKRIFNLIHMDYFLEIFDDKINALNRFKTKKDDHISKWQKAVEVNPAYADAHYQLALAYTNNGCFNDALKELDEAIRINNKYSKAYKLRGDIFKLKNNPEKAANNYQKALTYHPDYIEPKVELAILSQDANKLHEVEKILNKILKEKPGYADYNNYLGRVYAGLKNPEKAHMFFDNALRINPGFAEAWLNKAKIAKTENKAESVEMLKKALNNSKQKYIEEICQKQLDEIQK
ncbi:MAG: tetratricopeptide repeat protein [Candidatus Muiribacteriota bacterium]